MRASIQLNSSVMSFQGLAASTQHASILSVMTKVEADGCKLSLKATGEDKEGHEGSGCDPHKHEVDLLSQQVCTQTTINGDSKCFSVDHKAQMQLVWTHC